MIKKIYNKAYRLYIEARQDEYMLRKYSYDHKFEELLNFIKELMVENTEK